MVRARGDWYASVLTSRLDQGVMSGLLTGAAFTKQFPSIDTTNGGRGSSSLQGTVVAIYEIGCFFGAILAFVCGERLGRRWTIMLGCGILAAGAVIQAAAYGIPQLIVGRVVAGLGNGMNTATIRECKGLEQWGWWPLNLRFCSCLAFGTHEADPTRQRPFHRAGNHYLWRDDFLLGR